MARINGDPYPAPKPFHQDGKKWCACGDGIEEKQEECWICASLRPDPPRPRPTRGESEASLRRLKGHGDKSILDVEFPHAKRINEALAKEYGEEHGEDFIGGLALQLGYELATLKDMPDFDEVMRLIKAGYHAMNIVIQEGEKDGS